MQKDARKFFHATKPFWIMIIFLGITIMQKMPLNLLHDIERILTDNYLRMELTNIYFY